MLTIRIEDENPGQSFRIVHFDGAGDRLICESVGKNLEGQGEYRTLVEESRAARHALRCLDRLINHEWLENLKDHATAPKDRAQELALGFLDGLANVTQRFDCYADGVPDALGRPGYGSETYRRGWDLGRAIKRCADYTTEEEA